MFLSSNSQKARAGVLPALLVGALCLLSAAPAAAQRTIPSDPRNVQLTLGDGSLTLTWQEPASWGSFPASKYEINWQIGTNGEWQVNIPNPASTATSYTFTGTYGDHTVANGTAYQLRIRAVSRNSDPNDNDPELLSNWVTVSGTPNDSPFYPPPGKPTMTAITSGLNAPTATTLSFAVTCVSPGRGPVTDFILYGVNKENSSDEFVYDYSPVPTSCQSPDGSIVVTVTGLPSRRSATTYSIQAKARNILGQGGPWSDPIESTTPANALQVGGGDPEPRTAEFALANNHPNPFNPTTMIRYALPQAADVELTVYNALGQPVRTLVAAHQRAGRYAVEWDATGLAAGMYFYRLQAGGAFLAVEKMLLLK